MPKTPTTTTPLRKRRAVKGVYQRPLTPVRMAQAPDAADQPTPTTWHDPVDTLFPGTDPLSFMADEAQRDQFILSVGDISFEQGVVCPDMNPGM